MTQIIKDLREDYPYTPWKDIDFSPFENINDENNKVIIGIAGRNIKFNNINTIYFETEEPNKYMLNQYVNRDIVEDNFSKILSLCPYTTKWRNKIIPNKRIYCDFFPINPNIFIYPNDYQYDVGYIGNAAIYSDEFNKYVFPVMKKFKYNLLSDIKNNYVTHQPNNTNKLDLISKTKITISNNLVYEKNFPFSIIKKINNYEKNEAFKYLDKGIIPQFKWRNAETMMSKSLLLVRKDEWNIIENLYIENEHFLYYTNENLENVINDCLKNWDFCEKIIEKAYLYTLENYTTEKWVEKFIKPYII